MMQRKVNPQWLPKLRGECDLKSAQERQSFKLMKREELKSKKSRVENVLIQQYTVKYGTRASTSRINAFIKATVKDVIEESESGQVTEKMLDSLEMDIRDYLEMIKSESLRRPLTASTTVDELPHDYLAESNGGRSTAPENSSIRKNSNRKSKSVRIAVQHPDVDANHWSVVSAILAIDDDEQTSKEFKSMMSKKNMFKDGKLDSSRHSAMHARSHSN